MKPSKLEQSGLVVPIIIQCTISSQKVRLMTKLVSKRWRDILALKATASIFQYKEESAPVVAETRTLLIDSLLSYRAKPNCSYVATEHNYIIYYIEDLIKITIQVASSVLVLFRYCCDTSTQSRCLRLSSTARNTLILIKGI